MISVKQFYFYGMIFIAIAVLAGTYNLYLNWHLFNVWGRISTIFGSLLFQSLIALLFLKLYLEQKNMMTDTFSGSIDEFLKEQNGK